MAKQTLLEKRAKEVIIEQMRNLGEMTTENVMDLIRPHIIFDSLVAKEQLINRKANQLMSTIRDTSGTRTCFAAQVNACSTYINVDKTTNINALRTIETQLRNKFKGLNVSIKKVKNRKSQLSGQLSLEGLYEAAEG